MLRKNTQVIAGNLAEDAKIQAVSPERDALNLRVITNQEWTDNNGKAQSKMCGHNVVKFGKKGVFDSFAAKYLKKGMPVYAMGTTEKTVKGDYLNVTINTSFNGDIQPLANSMRLNEQTVGGNLAADAIVREAGTDREVISFTVITNDSYQGKDNKTIETSCGHDVVQFGKKGQFASLAALLKKGAGVYLSGTTEKENRIVPADGDKPEKKFLNVTLNATFNQIQITKYVTEKPAQG